MSGGQIPTYPEYEGLRALAEESVRRDGHLQDPVKFHRWQKLSRDSDWRVAVLGHNQRTSLVEMHMLLLADGQGIDPPLPAWLAELRAKQAAARAAEEAAYTARLTALYAAWDSLWQPLPVYVSVAYNYSGPHHYESHQSGAVHILLTNCDVTLGRAVRKRGWALCTTDSTVRHQLFDGFGVHPSARVATCKACLRFAARLAGLPEVPPVLLAG